MKPAALFGLLLSAAALPTAVAAEVPTGQTASDSAYEELLSVMIGGIDDEAILERVALGFGQQVVASNPDLQRMEARRPGMAAAIGDAVRPVFARHSARVAAAYRPRMLAALQQSVSAEEAASAIEYYRSDMGRTMLAGVSTNHDGTARVTDVMTTGRISQDAVESDIARTSSAAIADLDAEGQGRLAEAVSRYPVLLKLQRFVTLAMPIRTAMENEDLTAEDRAALTAAVRRGLNDYQAAAR